MPRNIPGRPLPPTRVRFVPLSGDPHRRYVDRDTGQLVSRYYAENSIAQKFGFRNLADYRQFTSQFGAFAGIGGLSGLRAKSVMRVKHLMEKWEDTHGWPRGSIDQHNPQAMFYLEQYLVAPYTQKRRQLEWLGHALDALGIRDFNPQLLPGETP